MIKNFQLAILNRLKQGGHIAAELPASSDQNRKWIAVYKRKNKPVQENLPEYDYSILEFELDKEKMHRFVGDEDLIMINRNRYYVASYEELIDKLMSLDVEPSIFTYPWKCDYPL